MESKNKANNNRVVVFLCVTAAVALVVGLGYLGTQNVSVVEKVTAPIRNLAQTTCAARGTKQFFTDLIKGTKAPSRVRILHVKESKKLKADEVGVAPLDQLVDSMSLEDQIGQILQPENTNAKCYEVSDQKVGSVFFGGNDSPGDDTPMAWHKRANQIQNEAHRAEPHHIPAFVGVDTIHGMSHMRGATLFPHNIALGCTRNEKLVEQVGYVTATESGAVDVNWGFAPCVALATDIRWGRIYESFGQDPDLVGRLGAAYVKGANSAKKPFVTCGKHFVGDGGARYGTGRIGKPVDRGDVTLTMEELRETHMKPYEYLVKAGIGSIMASYSSVNGTLMHGNTDLIQNELKGRMGFKGFVSSDYNAINALSSNYHEAVAKGINAGIDQIMLGPANGQNNPYPGQLANIIKKNVKEGKISKERIRDAAKRVLWAKYESGLMEQQPNHAVDLSKQSLEAQLAVVGQAQHRAIARQAVQEATVVLENKHKVLPLNIKERKVCVIGKAADDAGKMLGGWTLDWQSSPGVRSTPTTTVIKAIQQLAKAEGVPQNVKYVEKHNECQGSDVAIVVIAEDPYAEFMGDRTSMPKLGQTEIVGKIHDALNMPVILLAMPGRPVDVEKAVEKAASFVVSFVPGSEGGLGITDVLFGKVAPKGKLSVDWPKSGHAMVRIAKDETLLYKYGDGLTWKI
eukprot:gnl/MRDRNA2_/MRDRNA2_85255_c0_seq4.p1 gnl/MRDRNA2_/MRDRNA2_85255_c0~~gnl/MRDRNA2_/MRDRNA2_85255_c0_seq4.p1  ORF type:complete len:684 (+),score=161.59 gnl/MRDRNA2_/MRDRNA2_85255_c0_seq4:89-2140(+)